MLNGCGTFDAIAARRAFGDALLEDFPFSCLRLEDDHARAAGRKSAAADLRNPHRDDQLDRASRTRGSTGSSRKTCRGLAGLPVPLIVSVMGTSHEEFARLVEGVASRAEVAAAGAEHLLPERRSRG